MKVLKLQVFKGSLVRVQIRHLSNGDLQTNRKYQSLRLKMLHQEEHVREISGSPIYFEFNLIVLLNRRLVMYGMHKTVYEIVTRRS